MAHDQILIILICAGFFFALVSMVIKTGKRTDINLDKCEKIMKDVTEIKNDVEFGSCEIREGIKHFEERYQVATGKPFPRVNAEIGKNLDVKG